ncbi:MAG: hypothetical protein DVB22_002562 [Verrucomicrobia bacterium]|nr:MAG: hypothetical protein DVB22_002562 [Verrucomicrobiota bacterium]
MGVAMQRLAPFFVSLPSYIATVGIVDASADPRPMLLWYVCAGLSVLVSLVVGVLAIFDFFARRRQEARAAETGGYVTHPQLNKELAQVYAEFRRLFEELRKETQTQARETQRALQTLAQETSNLEGRLEGLPPRRTR